MISVRSAKSGGGVVGRSQTFPSSTPANELAEAVSYFNFNFYALFTPPDPSRATWLVRRVDLPVTLFE